MPRSLASVRKRLRSHPKLLAAWITLRRWPVRAAQQQRARSRRAGGGRLTGDRTDPAVVVSLTTFPARAGHAWIAIESILAQTVPPDLVVVALSEEEFPDRSIPRSLAALRPRGIEILWTPGDPRSYNKLAPARLAFPGATIVTVDDDVEYGSTMLERLLDAARRVPGTVVGHKGWEVPTSPSESAPYIYWVAAGPSTPSERLLLTGVGGVLYPPRLPSTPALVDTVTARSVCPTNDDVWFWAANRAAGVSSICLGSVPYAPVERTRFSPALGDVNRHANDAQIAAAVAHFEALGHRILPEHGPREP